LVRSIAGRHTSAPQSWNQQRQAAGGRWQAAGFEVRDEDEADTVQLQEKIQTIEQTASTKVAGAVDATKAAVGLGGKAAVGGAGGAPRMVLIGPPGAGTYLVSLFLYPLHLLNLSPTALLLFLGLPWRWSTLSHESW
jgi:hypothetical protein